MYLAHEWWYLSTDIIAIIYSSKKNERSVRYTKLRKTCNCDINNLIILNIKAVVWFGYSAGYEFCLLKSLI